MNIPSGAVTLIGSGEFSAAMARMYRALLARLPAAPAAVFLDTPAGFELNADAIYFKAAEYFSKRLDLVLARASFKNKTRATALESADALNALRRADFIFAGPGSPSYAIRNWRATPVWETVRQRFENGAQLVFASAAAIATSAFALPVYEIYKAGDDLFWLDGLDLFAALDMRLAIVPHWNNSEGGTYDTRFCFMGETRFRELEKLLARDVVVLGLDEYTACIFDLSAQACRVMGAGKVTIRRDNQEWAYASGETFPFARLRPRAQARENVVTSVSAAAPNESAETTRYLMELTRALDETHEPNLKRDLLERAHDTLHELSAAWNHSAHTTPQENIAPYVETLIEIRKQLRDAKQFALADEIRARLAAMEIVLEDDSAGTTWRKTE